MFIMRVLSKVATTLLLVSTFASSANDAANVDVYLAQAQTQREVLSLTGTIEATQDSALASQQAGLIESLYFEVGDTVEKGQKLLVIDNTLAVLAVEQAKSAVKARMSERNEAERLYQEVIELSKKELVAKTLLNQRLSSFEISDAMLKQANAELATAKEMLNRHTLYAPFSGVVSKRLVDVGEWVSQQTQIMRLVSQSNMRLNIAIPQEYYQVLNGQNDVEVTVTPDFNQGISIESTLSRIVGVADNQSRSITGLVNLPSNQNLVVGMSAHAAIELPQSDQNIVWLPKSAIKQHPDGGASVFVVNNNKAKRILINIVKQQGQQTAITGVGVEQPFVMSGVELLKDGDSLSINKQVSGS